VTTASTRVRCPDCGNALDLDPTWAPWCDSCDWGVDPGRDEPPPTPRAARRLERLDAIAAREHEALLRNGATPGTGHGWAAARALAVGVHLVTVLLVVGAVLLAVSPAWIGAKVVLVLLLAAIAWQVRPRRRRDLPEGPTLSRADAPALFALLDRVAAATGGRAPRTVVLDEHFNASYGTTRDGPVLVIGLPYWSAIHGQLKVSCLAHELAHDVGGDVRRLTFVGSALTSLYEWQLLLHPDDTMARNRADLGGSADGWRWAAFVELFAELFLPLVLLPFYLAVSWLRSALVAVSTRSGQRAEYLADVAAAEVAGTQAATADLESLFAAESCVFAMEVALRADASADIWRVARKHVAGLPEQERRRLGRLSDLRGAAVDDTHPPTVRRLEVVASVPVEQPRVTLLPGEEAAVDAELMRHARAVQRRFRDRSLETA
jgi:hypothetical protein